MSRRGAFNASQAMSSLDYKNKGRAITDVNELLAQTRSLNPSIEDYVYNNGTMAKLMSLSGTIPIYYNRVQYNIPVRIWVPQTYPQAAPICYVTPTKDMRIKRGHPNVDESGTVYMSYGIWNTGRTTLSELCVLLSQKFSANPPVYKYNPKTAIRRPVQSRPVLNQNNRPAQQPKPETKSWQQNKQYPQSQNPFPPDNPYASAQASKISAKAQLKETLLNQARESLQERTKERVEEQTEEMTRIMKCEAKLKQGEVYLAQSKAGLVREKDILKKTITSMENTTTNLKTWLEKNEGKEVSIDELVDGNDTWSKQILHEVAMDSAIEDTLYALDKGLEDGRLSLDDFLKQVRRLSKKQFSHRVLSLKIMEKQQARSAMQL